MPRIARIIAAGYPHHITQRGNNRTTVFFDDEEFNPFIGADTVGTAIDDFNGDKLDETKWIVAGSRDTLSFVKFGKENALRIGLKMGADMIQTNSISTRGKFSQQYGYFEASMRMNATDGHSGIFRVATDDEKTAPSITVSFHATGKDRVNPWARATLESGQQDFRPEKPLPPMKSGDALEKQLPQHAQGLLDERRGRRVR